MDKYISESSYKTPAMMVTVYDANDHKLRSYSVPEGFQLDGYVSRELHPNCFCATTWPLNSSTGNRDFSVRVLTEGNETIVTHLGVYQ